MKFSHIADVHLGNWRDHTLKELGVQAFEKAIDESVKEKVDFVLIAGDLFNTALPGIDFVKVAIKKLKQLNEKGISVYYIAGSHDFSPTGKTMLDVIEESGLGINVMKGEVENNTFKPEFVVDSKTGVKITGIAGLKGSLDSKYYDGLDLNSLEREDGFKIFMFHTTINELNPKKEIEGYSLNSLPKNFDYYAGGHVHVVEEKSFDKYKNVVYPGPLLPANFEEFEKLKFGNFMIYDNGKVIKKSIKLKDVKILHFDFTGLDVSEANVKLKKAEEDDFSDKIVLIRVEGEMKESPRGLDFKGLIHKISSEAYNVMKNTSKLVGKEFKIETIKSNTDDVEQELIKKHLNQQKHPFTNEEEAITELMKHLNQQKHEGETVNDYNERMKKEINTILDSLQG